MSAVIGIKKLSMKHSRTFGADIYGLRGWKRVHGKLFPVPRIYSLTSDRRHFITCSNLPLHPGGGFTVAGRTG